MPELHNISLLQSAFIYTIIEIPAAPPVLKNTLAVVGWTVGINEPHSFSPR